VESLDRAISDRKNLLESTQIATLFLDNDLRVKSFIITVGDYQMLNIIAICYLVVVPKLRSGIPVEINVVFGANF